jgi:hypothetical protein
MLNLRGTQLRTFVKYLERSPEFSNLNKLTSSVSPAFHAGDNLGTHGKSRILFTDLCS